MGLFSKLNTVQEMSEKASQFFHLDSDSLRLWDYHGNTKFVFFFFNFFDYFFFFIFSFYFILFYFRSLIL